MGIKGQLPLGEGHFGGQGVLIDVLQPRDHALHEDVAAAELPCGFVDNLLRTAGVGRVALHEYPVCPSLSELGQSFLGFISAVKVMDRDFLDTLSGQLHSNPTAESP